jgi:hypothetical protein
MFFHLKMKDHLELIRVYSPWLTKTGEQILGDMKVVFNEIVAKYSKKGFRENRIKTRVE